MDDSTGFKLTVLGVGVLLTVLGWFARNSYRTGRAELRAVQEKVEQHDEAVTAWESSSLRWESVWADIKAHMAREERRLAESSKATAGALGEIKDAISDLRTAHGERIKGVETELRLFRNGGKR